MVQNTDNGSPSTGELRAEGAEAAQPRSLLGKLTLWRALFWTLVALGLYVAAARFALGLGAVTNLSDDMPWGMWVGFDILVGVGLAAGGFVTAAAVHVFHLEHFKPIARPAVLTAFLGYLLVCAALLFDLGRPWNIWHPLVMWNPHSVMFEVAWCVMLYTTVLALEFSPAVLERLGWRRPLKVVHTIYLPLVIAGVLLSMMHQSSLGSFYLIMPDRLHGLWYSPWLPVFFFITAVAGGLAMTIIEATLSSRAFGTDYELPLFERLARVITVVLAVYAVWKVQNLAGLGQLGSVFEVSTESVMFWGEFGLGVLLPIGLLLSDRVRTSRDGLFFAAILVVMGFVMNRLNVAVTGMAGSTGYVPSWQEFTLTLALAAVGFGAFAWAAKHLAVFPRSGKSPPSPAPSRPPRPLLRGYALAAVWLLLLAGGILVGVTTWRAHAAEPEQAAAVVEPPETDELRLPDEITYPMGEDSPGEVTFRHESHVDFDAPRCGGECHAGQFPLRTLPPPTGAPVVREALTMKRMEKGEQCGACHNGEAAFGVADDCEICHQ